MQMDFHYYATYCAAILAGYSHEESRTIGYSSQFVDCCSRTLLKKLGAQSSAATTQLQAELMDSRTDMIGLQDITRIWASFHFLPSDLYADVRGSKQYKSKYRLICNPNGPLLKDSVELAKGESLQAVGIAMHILADTWAHRYFAGTPSFVINNTNFFFYELIDSDEGTAERKVNFTHNPTAPDNVTTGRYTNSIYQASETSIMNLGHGRAGHFPDYSFAKYKYMPAWGDYSEIVKNNQSDYFNAFCQMIYAMKYLRGDIESFETGTYDYAAAEPYKDEIKSIIAKRQLNACEDWKRFGEKLSGQEIADFDIAEFEQEYLKCGREEKDASFLGSFFIAAMAQKSMVTNKIFASGNLLAGFSVDYLKSGFKGIRDFAKLVEKAKRRPGEK